MSTGDPLTYCKCKKCKDGKKHEYAENCWCLECDVFRIEKMRNLPFYKKYGRMISGKDDINHPEHYTSHKSGIECIEITEWFSFTLGNAIKYIWRADLKNGVEDLKKAVWYLEREIKRRSVPPGGK